MKIIAKTITRTRIVELEPFEFSALCATLDDKHSLSVKAQRRIAYLKEERRKLEETETREINMGKRDEYSSLHKYFDTAISELERLLTVEEMEGGQK